jgi:hypothetical protein
MGRDAADAPGSYDEEWRLINDAGKPLILALPPRVAARVAVDGAAEVDRLVAGLSDALLAENENARAATSTSCAPITGASISTRSTGRVEGCAEGEPERVATTAS